MFKRNRFRSIKIYFPRQYGIFLLLIIGFFSFLNERIAETSRYVVMLVSLRCKKYCSNQSVYPVGWWTRNAVGKSKSDAFRWKNESPRKSLLLAHSRSTCKGLTDPWWWPSFPAFLPFFRPTQNDWRLGVHRLPSESLPVNGYYVYTARFFSEDQKLTEQ